MDWSGKTTAADVKLAFTSGGLPQASIFLLVLLAVVAVLYGRSQARLRRDTVRHFESRMKRLEKELDPHRTSSGLNPSGETPEEGK